MCHSDLTIYRASIYINHLFNKSRQIQWPDKGHSYTLSHRMHITKDYITQRFGYFNDLIFEGKLPSIPITLSRARTYLGQFRYCSRKSDVWNRRNFEYSMRFSTLRDMPPATADDILIHEMIHYYIAFCGIRDTSPHGTAFRRIMGDINRKFARNVRISYKIGLHDTHASASANSPNVGTDHNDHISELSGRGRLHAVAVLRLCGHTTKAGIKVLPRRADKIIAYYKAAMNVAGVSDVELYLTHHIYFDSFPVSSALRYHVVCLSDLIIPIERSRRVTIKNNHLVYFRERGSTSGEA